MFPARSDGRQNKNRFTNFHLETTFIALEWVENSLPPGCLEVGYFQGALWILSPVTLNNTNRILKVSSQQALIPQNSSDLASRTQAHFKPSFFSDFTRVGGNKLLYVHQGQEDEILWHTDWKSTVMFTWQKLVPWSEPFSGLAMGTSFS